MVKLNHFNPNAMKTISLLGISLLLALLISCSKEKTTQTEINPENKLVSYTDCKNLNTALQKGVYGTDTSCVTYSYDPKTKKLSLKHINAGFNCCPGILYCNFDLSNDTIVIKEFAQTAGCSCECLYDLDIKLYIEEPKNYYLIVEEPYCGSQQQIAFPIDLASNLSGSYCVYRDQYPWGM